MKRLRVLVAATFAVSVLSIVVAQPAYAVVCQEQPDGSCQCGDPVNRVWEKLFGGPLIVC
ncbi:MAG TPA: hypothetical protein VNP73_10505 [Actinomycetota bacterium]|nr:hypothetical protein [Actinomycetota bacterium]